MEKKSVFHLGKYDSNPFWHNPDMQSKSSNQKFLTFEDEKLTFESISRIFSRFNLENSRPEHA
jgi:hypothetical protein